MDKNMQNGARYKQIQDDWRVVVGGKTTVGTRHISI